MASSFFITERMYGGWRFWLFWVVVTIFGYFVGLGLEQALFGELNLIIAVPMAGLMQAWILNRHIVIFLPWVVLTALGWWIGMFIITLILNTFAVEALDGIWRTALIAVFSGAIAGLFQWLPLHIEVKKIGLWWVIVSAISQPIPFLSGAVNGIPLAIYLEYDYRDLEYRPWPPA